VHALEQRDVRQREHHDGRQVHGQRPEQPLPLEPEVLRQPDDGRREGAQMYQ
jgi:hypothetical protein